MIYNLVQYLKDEFPTEMFYANLYVDTVGGMPIPDRMSLIRETGGTETPWFRFVRKLVQIISRDFDAPKARELAFSIYEELTSRFGLVLPAVTVNGTAYPEVQIPQISANQQPYCLGSDETGRTTFSCNYQILFKED